MCDDTLYVGVLTSLIACSIVMTCGRDLPSLRSEISWAGFESMRPSSCRKEKKERTEAIFLDRVLAFSPMEPKFRANFLMPAGLTVPELSLFDVSLNRVAKIENCNKSV